MKKIIFAAATVAIVFMSFNSCTKKVSSKNSPITTETSPQKVISICPLADVNTTDYFTLATVLFGNQSGMGTSGSIDKRLNCQQAAGTNCGLFEHTINLFYYTSDVNNPDGASHPLSDGVMTVAEQQTLITQIKNHCTGHMNSIYPNNGSHSIVKYDVSWAYPLCGCSVSMMVKYTVAKKCPVVITPI